MLALVYGTRPEVVKLGIVADLLREQEVPFIAACTGQHTTLMRGMPQSALRNAAPLLIPNDGDVATFVKVAEGKLSDFFEREEVTHVVVQGDTMSALAAARAAAGRPVAHVEAGIRSYDKRNPWPEEGIRVEIDKIASLHLAPTLTSRYNLILEGIDSKSIVVTGNTGMSALAKWGATWQEKRLPRVLVTMHRREWYMREGAVKKFAFALMKAADGLEETVVWPVHPAISDQLPPEIRTKRSSVLIQYPMSYERFSTTLAWSRGVLTDSGGVTEEAAALGVPCAVMRKVTDRPEAEDFDVAARFQSVDPALRWVTSAGRTHRPCTCFGLPDAAERSVAAIRDWLSAAR